MRGEKKGIPVLANMTLLKPKYEIRFSSGEKDISVVISASDFRRQLRTFRKKCDPYSLCQTHWSMNGKSVTQDVMHTTFKYIMTSGNPADWLITSCALY